MTASNSTGTQTPQRLVAVASKMFAEGSVDGVSIRSITREAAVGPAAVHYHFKTKDALLQAVLQRHGTAVLRAIADRGGSLALTTASPTPRQVVECVAIPYFELLERDPVGGVEWLRIVAHLAKSNDLRASHAADEATAQLHALIAACFPECDAERRLAATSIAVNSLLSLVSQLPVRGWSDQSVASARVSQELIVEFVAGGLTSAIFGASNASATTSGQ